MAETTADVRRDIELTRERMSETIAELEDRVNVMKVVREHPWPVIALAAGAGFVLARSKADVKAAAASVAATGGARTKVASLLDDLAARVITEVTAAANERVDAWVSELKDAIVGAAGAAARPAPRGGRRSESDREVWRPVSSDIARTGERSASADVSGERQDRGARSEGLH
jgi:hypothetical protein